MTPMPDLFDYDDAQEFLSKENSLWAQAKNDMDRGRLLTLQRQSAWILLEKAFHDNPQLYRVEVEMKLDDSDYQVELQALDRQGGTNEFLKEVAESAFSYFTEISKMPHRLFFLSLGMADLDRDHLKETASEIFSPEWLVERRSHQLNRTFPVSTSLRGKNRI